MIPLERDPLLTDLYQLTMLHGYFEHRMEATAVFELFVRKLPEDRNFLIAAGLEQAVEFLEGLRFEPEALAWLRQSGHFSAAFLEALGRLRFAGDLDALPEGTVVFANEPLLRVVAPLPEAQLVESRLINLLNFETLIASKAARLRIAAPDRLLVDFGLRRAHGAEAGLLGARAAYLGGLDGTATVLAGMRYGIPLYGTMAHSFIQAHEDEGLAFEHFALAQPDNVVLLIDTYDTEQAARKVVALGRRLASRGIVIKAVRIDSGDLAVHARRVRAILDAGGLTEVTVFASGDLDEYSLARYTRAAIPIDGYGIGTRLSTSADAPYLNSVYKLTEYAGRPRLKRSEEKATLPGRKQVYRRYGSEGRMERDILTLAEAQAEGEPLLRPVLRAGRRVAPLPSLAEVRRHAREQLERLPAALRSLDAAPRYPVEIAPVLAAMAGRC